MRNIMKDKVITLLLLFVVFSINDICGQEVAQTIRGVVIDNDSQITLPGASLVIKGSDPQIGTITDVNGEFTFGKLPIGRYDIVVYYIGYETTTVSNILLNSGKETVLHIELTEAFTSLDEVVVTAEEHKNESVNEMATVSAKKVSIEEASHVAGSIDDAGRMVATKAGVASSGSGTNDIIIRGNSPKGMVWRLEGLDIPNPNHYATDGSSSGGVSILNGATLSNSDFFTSAFPAEYGNAYSGVFDMKMRYGNNQRREYTLQAGFKGIDVTLEGPFSKKSPASYLVSYRYSSLMILEAMGIKILGDATPDFQDITYKINVPTKKAGVFTFFGIGGLSTAIQSGDGSTDSHETESGVLGTLNFFELTGLNASSKETEDFTNTFKSNTGVFGIKNRYFFNNTMSITSIIAYTGSKNIVDYKRPDSTNFYQTRYKKNNTYQTPKISVSINKKFNSRNTINVGANADFIGYRLFSERYDQEKDMMQTEINQSGETTLLQMFATWKHRFSESLTLVAGIHDMFLLLNNKYTIEPRLGINWQFNSKQALNFGLGLHSRMESLSTYFAENIVTDRSIVKPNEDLGFAKAAHIVLGYDNMLTENIFFNAEIYYQYLYQVPVENYDTSSFSMLNYNSGHTNKSLVNEGTGYNYGLEVTIDKYFSSNYYFTVTASVFDSKYKALDNIERSTRYNSNYVFNLLGGKDFIFFNNKEKKRTLGLNIRGMWAGGQHTTPINIEQSQIYGHTIRNEELAFSDQWEDLVLVNFKISFTMNRKKSTHTLELDMQNITNNLNVIDNAFNPDNGKIRYITQMGFVPIFNYRVVF
ncbi:MAG: TonB-dependent receptor [Bacteroidetes bacterium]|nr:MAG: TonB-dependent receptor [Bacteroidota bacterium]